MYCSAACRHKHQNGVASRAIKRATRPVRKYRRRLGSKGNPIIVVQCPRCHLMYAAAVAVEGDDALCRSCRAGEAA